MITVSAKALKHFHMISMVVWLILCYPTVKYWSQSISYLVFISVYSIIVGHFASWQSSRIEVKEEKKLEKELDESVDP